MTQNLQVGQKIAKRKKGTKAKHNPELETSFTCRFHGISTSFTRSQSENFEAKRHIQQPPIAVTSAQSWPKEIVGKIHEWLGLI